MSIGLILVGMATLRLNLVATMSSRSVATAGKNIVAGYFSSRWLPGIGIRQGEAYLQSGRVGHHRAGPRLTRLTPVMSGGVGLQPGIVRIVLEEGGERVLRIDRIGVVRAEGAPGHVCQAVCAVIAP